MNERNSTLPEREPQPRMIEKLYVIDFDRCLGNVDAVVRLAREAALTAGVDTASMEAAQHEIEASKGSFNLAGWVRDNYSPEVFDAFIANYLTLEFDVDSLLEPGAREFLDQLIQNDIPFMIMTTGGDIWQNVKLQRAGLADMPTMVTPLKEKGTEIASWQGERSLSGFQVPEAVAGDEVLLTREVILIDDKAVSFAGLPKENAHGYAIQHHSDEVKQSQEGELPSNVSRVTSFAQIAKLEGMQPLQQKAA